MDEELEIVLGDDVTDAPEELLDLVVPEADALPDSLDHFRNLVPEIEWDILAPLGASLMTGFDSDIQSRQSFSDTIQKGVQFLGVGFDTESGPFDGACSAIHPLLTENACKYQAKFSRTFLPVKGPYAIDIIDRSTPNIDSQAKAYQNKLNLLTTTIMTEFYREMDKLFLYVPYVGTGIKKVYFDPILQRPSSRFIRIEDFVTQELTSDLDTSERFSHVFYRSPEEFEYDLDVKTYYVHPEAHLAPSQPWESPLKTAIDAAMDLPDVQVSTEVYTLIEMYVNLKLEGTEFESDTALPYTVTLDRQTSRIVGLRRNWYAEDINHRKIVPFVDYTFIPGLGYLGMGLIHLLGGLEQAATAIMRSLVDSGSFSNLQGGFKAKSLRFTGDNTPHAPGEFKEVDLMSSGQQFQKLEDAIMPLPFKEPSATLFQMLQYIVTSGQKFADNLEQTLQDSANYGKVGTTMALMEESSQFFTAVFNRIYIAFRRELTMIADLANRYMGAEYQSDLNQDGKADLLPAADPNYPTRSHRLALEQTKLNLALQAPQVHNLDQAFRGFYLALGDTEEDIQMLLKQPAQAKEQDPLADIQSATMGQPIKAFPGQDHDAHIQVKTMFLQDPLAGGSEIMMQIRPVIEANIREHTVQKYIEMVQGTTQEGFALQNAAQMVMTANQQALMNQQGSTPEQILAETEQRKQDLAEAEFDHNKNMDYVDKLIDVKELEIKAAEAEAKVAQEMDTLDMAKSDSKIKQALELIALDGKQKADMMKASQKPTPKPKGE